jgi:hypothetical protein
MKSVHAPQRVDVMHDKVFGEAPNIARGRVCFPIN